MAAYTDAQLKVLAGDVQTALQNERAAANALATAKAALAAALGPGGTMIIQNRQVTANADASDLTVSPVRVVV